ncbi:MAG TPA: acyloxyacyl hydrolase [Gammaproteobacteria bacterium]
MKLITFLRYALCMLAGGFAAPATAQQVSVGSAAAVRNFNDLTYHYATLVFPVDNGDTGWRPDAWTASVGFFWRDDDEATVYAMGPKWRWEEIVAPCECFVDLGFSVAYLEQRRFLDADNERIEDFGKELQFLTRISLGWYIDTSRHWSMETSFMHISNGGLGRLNPGVNLMGIDLQFEF